MTHELKTGGDRGYLRIATEEAFATREQMDAILALVKAGKADKGTTSLWGFYGTSPSARAQDIMERLVDLGDLRINTMNEMGIDKAVLALTAPGVQPLETELAKGIAQRSNDILAEAVEKHPTRYIGMTCVAPQDPQWSAQEIRRGAELGFKGIQINSHTQGHYLDEPQFDPIFKALVDVDQPLYIHPQTLPDNMLGDMIGAGLDGAIYGFGVETSYHLLRLITTGIFDRYPSLKIIVGHMGEAIPFWLYRIDWMHQAGVRSQRYERLKPLKKTITDYMRENVYITTSGMAFGPAIKYSQEVLGDDRVMYAMDYPYQFVADEVRTHDLVDISDESRKKLMQTNAEKVFKL